MNSFKQIIRFENSEANKDRVIEFIKNLHTSEKLEHEVVIKPYKKSKSLEQLGYYWGVIIPTVCEWEGFTCKGKSENAIKIEESADYFLKKNCCTPIYMEIMGETYEIKTSIAKMKVNQMAKYIDDCVNFLGVQGQAVSPPHYKGEQ